VGTLWLDRIKLSIPLAGSILHRFAISEFGRSLSTLLAGGLPLVPSLEVAISGVGNAHLRSRLEPVTGSVREGSSLHRALENTAVVPDLAIDMVKVGEATGALDEMLANVSDFLDEEIETKIQRLLTLVEPLMLVIMGCTVALLLLAMYLPLFSVLGQVQ
jgi:type IV pilus assembly protein PilC